MTTPEEAARRIMALSLNEDERTVARALLAAEARIAGLVAQDEVKSGIIRELDAEIERLRAGRAAVVEECAKEADAVFVEAQKVDSVCMYTAKNIAARIRALKGGAA